MNNVIKTGNDFMRLFNSIQTEHKLSEVQWIKSLRKAGVKAAHPDDGWVDRTTNIVTFAYPQFDDGVSPGDYIALGYSFWAWRIVRVVSVERQGYYKFEDLRCYKKTTSRLARLIDVLLKKENPCDSCIMNKITECQL